MITYNLRHFFGLLSNSLPPAQEEKLICLREIARSDLPSKFVRIDDTSIININHFPLCSE